MHVIDLKSICAIQRKCSIQLCLPAATDCFTPSTNNTIQARAHQTQTQRAHVTTIVCMNLSAAYNNNSKKIACDVHHKHHSTMRTVMRQICVRIISQIANKMQTHKTRMLQHKQKNDACASIVRFNFSLPNVAHGSAWKHEDVTTFVRKPKPPHTVPHTFYLRTFSEMFHNAIPQYHVEAAMTERIGTVHGTGAVCSSAFRTLRESYGARKSCSQALARIAQSLWKS